MNRDVARRVRAPRIGAGGVRHSEPPYRLPHQICNLGLFVWLALMWPLVLTAQLGGAVGTAVLNGAVSPRIRSSLDRGRLDPTKTLSHITLTLQRTPEQRTELERLLEQQQDPLSPNYRKWLTPGQFADRFGAPASEIDEIADWLRSQGFTVESTARSRGWIVFSGVAGQAETAFHTEIHQYESGGRLHFGPAAPPAIPARFDGRIESIRGLDDFYPEPPRRFRPLAELANGGNALAPGDLVRIYGFNTQAFSYPTAGWQIAIAGDSDINLSDIQQFQNTFQLAYNMPRLVLVGDDPGVDTNGGLLEANADLEWADAAAPRASLIYVYAQNVFDAAQEAIDQNLAQILSFSYGECESDVAAGDAAAIRDLAQLANAQGITWVASSGDAGAAACDAGSYPATQGLSVSFPASMPEVTGVGGTEFNEGSGSYWTTNRPDYSSATGYIPEVAWNDSSQTLGLWASGGGLSVLYQGRPGKMARGYQPTARERSPIWR